MARPSGLQASLRELRIVVQVDGLGIVMFVCFCFCSLVDFFIFRFAFDCVVVIVDARCSAPH